MHQVLDSLSAPPSFGSTAMCFLLSVFGENTAVCKGPGSAQAGLL